MGHAADTPKLWLPPKPAIIRAASKADLALIRKIRRSFIVPMPVGFLGAGTIRFKWTDAHSQVIADQATSTHANRAIGTASGTRLVGVTVGARGSSGASRTITGLTIAGAAASLIVASATNANPTAIFLLLVTSGATATIVVTANGTMSRCGIGVFTLEDYLQSTARDTDHLEAASGTSIARPLDILDGGIGIWTKCHATAENTSWTNADEQHDSSGGTVHQHSTAKFEDPTIETRTGTASWATTSSNTMCAASWR